MRAIRTLAISILPFVLFWGIAALSSRQVLPNPTVHLRADLAALSSMGGAILGATVLAATALCRWRTEQARRQSTAALLSRVAEDRLRFLRRLDHELKNPLTAIRAGLANLAETTGAHNEDGTLASVEAEVLRLSHLTADLRKLAELETRPLEKASVDLVELLREALDLAREQTKAHGRQLALTVPQAPWPLPSVLGDWDLLFLAVYNLLDNALKYTRPGDTIEIRALEDGDTVVLEVADTGPGIPEAEKPHVWEELFRGKEARGVRGSGLGLALVQAIVEGHGGTAGMRSRTGQGTVFTLRLPAR